MMDVLEQARPDALQKLRTRAISELEQWTEIEIRHVSDDRSAGGGCSVAGAYYANEAPPVVAVALSASPGRRAFTALHELGHHLQQNSTALGEVLLAQPDQGAILEELACDAFAGTVLLPADVVHRHIGERGPTAHNVVNLWNDSNASRAAVCVRAAEGLPAPGHVVLLNRDGTVSFAASHGLPPVKRDSDQSAMAVIGRALASNIGTAKGRDRFFYRDGIRGEELWLQTAEMGEYIVSVAVTDHAPWEDFAPTSSAPTTTARWWTCEGCGHDFPVWGTSCSTCAKPTCPECGHCDCAARVAERTCTVCWMRWPLARFNGASTRCRDCE